MSPVSPGEDPIPHVYVPLKKAPAALASARPGDRVKIEATMKVTSISENEVSGDLLDITSGGEGAETEDKDEDVDLSDSAVEKKKAAPKGEGNKTSGGIAMLAKRSE